MTGSIDRVEVITSVQRRRRWSLDYLRIFLLPFSLSSTFARTPLLLVAGFQADRIGLQGPGIADFGCYRLSRSTVPFSWGPK